MLTFSQQRPRTAAQLPIRAWARSIDLPANPTGPIRETVRRAHTARQARAGDERARAVFTKNALYAQQPAPRPAITHPRRARPEGHINPRGYN